MLGNESIHFNINYSELEGLMSNMLDFKNISNYDMNDLTLRNGIYGISKDGNISNNTSGINYGCLLNATGKNVSILFNANCGFQLAIDQSGSSVKIRALWGTWKEWLTIV